ncbi:MAG: phosphatidate cytidylyltransferase [Ilumatobacteraceae bacterium]
MSDDIWRDRRDDDFSEFGSLFDDDPPSGGRAPVRRDPVADTARGDTISFDDHPTGSSRSMPHWSEPGTGEVPQFSGQDDDEEFDVWSSFSSDAPVWQDDRAAPIDEPRGRPTGEQRRVTGEQRRVLGPDAEPRTERVTAAEPSEPGRITIGTDPSGMTRRPLPSGDSRSGPSRRRPPPPGRTTRSSGRDMPTAIAVGMLLATAFIGALLWQPWAVAVIVTLVLGLAAIEFYDKVAEKGYRPAVVPGILTCVAAPVATYWLGTGTLSLVIPFGFMAVAASFIGARSVEVGPMPNASITMLGVVWIGFLGTFAIAILRLSTQVVTDFPDAQALAANRGTDTLFLLALGVVANDVGALVFGSAIGRTPLRPWISPNKTVEGFIGGALATTAALMFVGLSGRSTTWSSSWHLLALAGLIAVMAPMGDLVESMFKRNLDVKDFGTMVKGHGGVLDRFDGFLFALPAVYYLTIVVEPWAAYTGL